MSEEAPHISEKERQEILQYLDTKLGGFRTSADFTDRLLKKAGLPPLRPGELEAIDAGHIPVWDIQSRQGDEEKLRDWIEQSTSTIDMVHFTTEVPTKGYRDALVSKLKQDKPVRIRRIVHRRPEEEQKGIYAWLDDFRDEGDLRPNYREYLFRGTPLDHDFIIFDSKRVARFRPNGHPELSIYNDIRLIENEKEAQFHLSIFNSLLEKTIPATNSTPTLPQYGATAVFAHLPSLEDELEHASNKFFEGLTARTRIDDLEIAKKHFYEAELYFQEGPDQSYEKASEHYKNAINTLNFPLAFLRLGQCYVHISSFSQAEETFRDGLSCAITLGYSVYRPYFHENVGRALYHRGLMKKAFIPLKRAFTIFEQHGNREGAAYALMYIGRASCHLGNYITALGYHGKALEIFEDLGDIYGRSQVINAQGRVHSERGEYQQAQECFTQVLDVFRQADNTLRIAQTLNNIAQNYLYQKDMETALHLCHQSLAMFKYLNNIPGLSRSFNTLGRIYSGKQNYEEALDKYLTAIKYAKDLDDTLLCVTITNNIGLVNAERAAQHDDVGDNPTAKILFDGAENDLYYASVEFEKLGALPSLALNYTYLSRFHYLKGNMKEAEQYQFKSELVKDCLAIPDSEEVNKSLVINHGVL